MTVTLTPHLKQLVNAKVKGDRYADASEKVCEGLRLTGKMDKVEPADFEALIAEADGKSSTPMTAKDLSEVRPKVLDKER